MVYTVSCGISHVSVVSTPPADIKNKNKNALEKKQEKKASHSCRTTCERSESAQESGE